MGYVSQSNVIYDQKNKRSKTAKHLAESGGGGQNCRSQRYPAATLEVCLQAFMSCEAKRYSVPNPWSAFPVGEEFSLHPVGS